MKRVCALVIGCFALAAHAEDWQATLTPAVPGPFPPPRPLHAIYRFGWAAVHAANGEFDISKTEDGLLKFEVSVKTEGVVRKLWSLDATHTALCNPATLRPVSALQKETYKKQKVKTTLAFDEKGVARLRVTKLAAKNPTKPKRFDFPGLFDLHTALLFVRSQPLKPGDTVRMVVYPTESAYLAEVEVGARAKIEVGRKKYDAIRLDLKLRQITKKLELEAHDKFKRATAWLSDDRDRLLLKIEAEVFVGSVWAEMESVEFSDER